MEAMLSAPPPTLSQELLQKAPQIQILGLGYPSLRKPEVGCLQFNFQDCDSGVPIQQGTTITL